MIGRSLWRVVTLACGAGLLSGCISISSGGAGPTFRRVDFEGSDNNVFQPTMRASFLVADSAPLPGQFANETGETRREGRKYADRGWRLSIDGELAYGRGNFDQTLDSSGGVTDQLQLADITYNGPSEVRGEVRLTTASIQAHGQGFVNPHLAFDLMAGLALTDLHAQTSSAGVKDRAHRTAFGPQLGVGISVYPVHYARIYGLVSYHLGAHAGDETELQRYEAGIEGTVLPGVALFGGWRLWRYRADRGGSFHTDVDVDLMGPTLGVLFSF
ncbi:MAG: hypothetical protein AAF488_07430 [Planctomycetota bacterium]